MSQRATLWPAGIASRVSTPRPSTRSSVPAGRATRAMATLSVGCRWMAALLALGTLVISTSTGILPFQIQFAVGNFGMDVQAAIDRVDQDAIAVARDGDVGGFVDNQEMVVRQVRQQLADVQVDVALRALLRGVERDAPRVVGPRLAGLGDGGGPVARALLGRHLGELLRVIAVKARDSEPAVRLVGVCVAQKEVLDIGGLLFGFLAEAALVGREGFRDVGVAETGAHVGTRERQRSEKRRRGKK